MGNQIIIYYPYSLFAKHSPMNLHRVWAYVAGFLTGLIYFGLTMTKTGIDYTSCDGLYNMSVY